MDRGTFGNPSGVLVDASEHHVFVPGSIPLNTEYDDRLVGELGRTERSLGALRTTVESFPTPDGLAGMFEGMEAVMSSSIEGTTATFQDTLRWDLGQMLPEDARRLRMREVPNCLSILLERWPDAKSGGPVDNDAIKRMHRSLWLDVEGNEAHSGEFRLHQNWIGGGRQISDAKYVPPPPRYVSTPMDDSEAFLNDPPYVPGLLQYAIAHYQFEAIHPFHDGNGGSGGSSCASCCRPRRDLPGPWT